MVRVPMTWTTMELLPLVCLCVLTWSGSTSADGNGKYVVVKEGEDAILPCSLSTTENIELKLFDWKKDGQKDVFMYNAGVHSNKGQSAAQDAQFRGRVFHFPDQLKVGNASILIKQTKVTDRGNYTCIFPNLQPRRQFHIILVVGAARKPYVTRVSDTKHNAVLQCQVQGAFPKPQLQWQDSDKNIIPAEEQVTESEGPYDIILQTTVTKTDNYRCVATQVEINHQVYSDIYEYVGGAAPEPYVTALKVTKDSVVLQCKVRGAFPKPQLQWQDSTGNIVPAEKPQVTESEGRYDVILNTTVTKTDHYRCVVTQEGINHQIYSETYVNISGSGFPTGWVLGGVVGVVVFLVAIGVCCWYKKRRRRQNDQDVSEPMKP